MGKDETIPKQMTSQANSVLNKFKAAENGGGLLHVATKPLNQSVSPSLLKRQQSGDEIRKAFEKELMAGKQKLGSRTGWKFRILVSPCFFCKYSFRCLSFGKLVPLLH